MTFVFTFYRALFTSAVFPPSKASPSVDFLNMLEKKKKFTRAHRASHKHVVTPGKCGIYLSDATRIESNYPVIANYWRFSKVEIIGRIFINFFFFIYNQWPASEMYHFCLQTIPRVNFWYKLSTAEYLIYLCKFSGLIDKIEFFEVKKVKAKKLAE